MAATKKTAITHQDRVSDGQGVADEGEMSAGAWVIFG
jgi:hypothetical protein